MKVYFYTVTFKNGTGIDINIRARNKKHSLQGLDLKLIGLHNNVKEIEFNAVENDYQ